VSGFALDATALSRERRVVFRGPEGRMEGMWRPPRAGVEPRGAAVIAHPHPAFGGTMHNKVVFHTARVLNHDLDVATLRFNFRGVGSSAGVYDEGRGEREDLLAAWSEARARVPGGPLLAAGFSFGAAITLLTAARDLSPEVRPAALAVLGLPFGMFPPPSPFPHPTPLAAVHGERDRFTAPDAVRGYLESWPGPHAFHVEPRADHFFEGCLPAATGFLSGSLGGWLFGGDAVNRG